MRFRKRPVVIDAIVFDGTPAGASRVFKEFDIPNAMFFDNGVIKIKTLEGVMSANAGDWIIKGVAGEFYPCKPAIFAATYEACEVKP